MVQNFLLRIMLFRKKNTLVLTFYRFKTTDKLIFWKKNSHKTWFCDNSLKFQFRTWQILQSWWEHWHVSKSCCNTWHVLKACLQNPKLVRNFDSKNVFFCQFFSLRLMLSKKPRKGHFWRFYGLNWPTKLSYRKQIFRRFLNFW